VAAGCSRHVRKRWYSVPLQTMGVNTEPILSESAKRRPVENWMGGNGTSGLSLSKPFQKERPVCSTSAPSNCLALSNVDVSIVESTDRAVEGVRASPLDRFAIRGGIESNSRSPQPTKHGPQTQSEAHERSAENLSVKVDVRLVGLREGTTMNTKADRYYINVDTQERVRAKFQVRLVMPAIYDGVIEVEANSEKRSCRTCFGDRLVRSGLGLR